MPTNHSQTPRVPAVADLVDPAESLDPIGQLPPRPVGAPRSAADEASRARGGRIAARFGMLALIVAFFVGSWLAISLLVALPGPLPGIVLLALFLIGGLYTAWAGWRDGPHPIADALRARAPDIDVMPTARTFDDPRFEASTGLVIGVRPGPDARPFDPRDPEDQHMAATLYRCRLADGLALDDGLRVDLPRVGHDPRRPKDAQLTEWIAVWRWLQGRSDPRAAWLGAMALAEQGSPGRALRALEALGDAPWLDALLEHMTSQGAFGARAAVALYGDDAGPLDALIAQQLDAAPALLLELLRARLRRPAPPIERWLETPALGPALVALDASRLTAAQWLRLVEHPTPAVAAAAATRALNHDVACALRAARTLLARPDLRAAVRDDADAASAVELMLIRLGIDGDASDLVRVGAWLEIRPLRRAARRELNTLQARTAGLPAGGGLALSVEGGGELALSGAAGQLSPASASDASRPLST